MPDGIQPVGAMIKTPDPNQGISTISGILGLKQQQQNLQTGQYQQQQEQLKMAQAQGVQDFFKTWDPTQHIADDGSTDLDSALQSKEFKGAGNAKPGIMQALLDIKNKQLGNKQALATLNSDLVKQFGTGMGALAKDDDVVADKTDPATGVNAGRAKIDQFLGNFGKLSPDAARIAQIYGPITQHAPPGKLSHGVSAMQLQAQSASEQQSQQNPVPGMIDTGANLLPVTTNRATGIPQPTGQQISKQVGPGANVVSDAYGRQFILNPQTNQVSPVGAGAAPGAPQPARPNAPQFQQPIPGQADAQATIEATRKADADYGVNRHVNDQILRLSKDTATGPGTEIWHHALGGIAGPGGGNNVADYQTIGAYLDRQAALSAKQMGLPDTNAGLATAASLSGTTSYQPKALQTKVKLTDALVEGAHQFREGLDKAIGTGPNQDLSKYQAFRGAWAANFDPNIYRVENAIKRGDRDELAQIKKEVGPQGMAVLKRKSDNLRLLENGQIP